MFNEYQKRLRERLQRMQLVAPPLPWKHVATHAAGGLTEIGYAPDSDLLLVISSNGRGVYDCRTGERVARDREEIWEDLDETRLVSRGIGPLSDLRIRLAGLHGGGLPTTTEDGWNLDIIALDWPQHSMFLTLPYKSLFQDDGHSYKITQDGVAEFRAAGFSETGRSFVFATGSDLEIYARIPKSNE